ncbi:hypothetical protein [Roseomonas indoligenes]|uniref:DUF2599 domain-containing protein n=1 Tax=Roseomonas indoligenes TaxID=2820811 RepID=A0A940S8A9_9PROT|nr:hypothetical protein [Pararoseomonas indoligenes]MBP0493917.1 hypothetical protein [Pararoseomonas indoligenes]
MRGGARPGRRGLGAALLLALPAGAQPLPPGAEVEAAWAALGPSARGWSPLVSPAFPLAWPPDGTAALRRYAFAYRQRPGLADGVEVAAPWAAAETRPGAPTRIILLAGGLAPLGIQGVRPLRPEEMRLIEREAEVAALLAAPPDRDGAALIRAFHCNWASRQGVVARTVAPDHPDFIAWLGCG